MFFKVSFNTYLQGTFVSTKMVRGRWTKMKTKQVLLVFPKPPPKLFGVSEQSRFRSRFEFQVWHSIYWGAFNNYIRGQNFAIFLPSPPAWTVFILWAWTKTDIFWPPPPHLVHVVSEWPLTRLVIWAKCKHVYFRFILKENLQK